MDNLRHDRTRDWLAPALEQLERDGYFVLERVLDDAFLEATRGAMYRAQEGIQAEVGRERLERAGELGVLRLPMKFDPHFFRFLEVPELLAVVDATVSPTAIMHLQNAFILPSYGSGSAAPDVFQNTYHRDFPRYLNGYVASVNVFFAIDEFRADNGATFVVPGSHQKAEAPKPEDIQRHAVPALCPAGSMLVFDSTLWHAAGRNVSGRDRLAINHQFTRSYIKQQVDYVRALGADVVQAQPPRTQQLLGWYTRVVTSLDEYYRPAAERLYRGGQG
jgi:ectoine hydroxylase-related dioxygenase (phytanoyl-CoA dioxygenase family)